MAEEVILFESRAESAFDLIHIAKQELEAGDILGAKLGTEASNEKTAPS